MAGSTVRVLGFLALSCALALGGCASLENYTLRAAPARQYVAAGDFQRAAEVFPERSARGRNEVLIRLERGMLLHEQGRFKESFDELDLAWRRMKEYEERAVVSVSKTAAFAGTLAVNEQFSPYTGEDHEKVMLHAINAVNFLMLGDLEAARVEVLRAYAVQRELSERHPPQAPDAQGGEAGATWEDSLRRADAEGYRTVSAKAAQVMSPYHNAYASIVSALVYELTGEPGEAYIELKKAYEAFPASDYLANELLRLSAVLGYVEDRRAWELRFGRKAPPVETGVSVVVFFSHGLGPTKEPVTLPIPLKNGVVFASLPVYRFTPSAVSHARVSVGGRSTVTSPILDIDAVAARTLMDTFPGLFAKQVARSFLKARAVSGMAHDRNGLGAFFGTLLAAATEQADLRTWSTLPKQIQASRIFVPAGERQVQVEAFPTGYRAAVEIPPGARCLVVVCRHTDAGLSVHSKSY